MLALMLYILGMVPTAFWFFCFREADIDLDWKTIVLATLLWPIVSILAVGWAIVTFITVYGFYMFVRDSSNLDD